MISSNVTRSDRRGQPVQRRRLRGVGVLMKTRLILKLVLIKVPMFAMVAVAIWITACGVDAAAQTMPDWATEGSFSQDGDQFELLKTEDVFLRSEASMILMDLIRQSVSQRTDEVLGIGGHRYVPLTDQYIQRHLVDEEMVIEKLSVDPVTEKQTRRHQGLARLRFGSHFDGDVRRRYHLNLQTRRLKWAGLTTILVLSWLATAYGYLKLDNATRHFYSRRLQTMAILSCLIPLVIAVWLAVAWRLF